MKQQVENCPECGNKPHEFDTNELHRTKPVPTATLDLSLIDHGLHSISQMLEELKARPAAEPVDLKPVLDQLAAYSEAVKQDVEHPTPDSAFDHWNSCPNCKPKADSYLAELIGGVQAQPPAPEAPKPAEQPKAEIPLAKPKPEPLKRKAFEHWVDVPGSENLRDFYGVEPVRENDKWLLKFKSEVDYKKALEDESRVIPPGCTVKCDDSGCWWVCEE